MHTRDCPVLLEARPGAHELQKRDADARQLPRRETGAPKLGRAAGTWLLATALSLTAAVISAVVHVPRARRRDASTQRMTQCVILIDWLAMRYTISRIHDSTRNMTRCV